MTTAEDLILDAARARGGFAYQIGQRVKKVKGYDFYGVIVARYPAPHDGSPRYVVSNMAPFTGAFQHIFNEQQIKALEPNEPWPWEVHYEG